MEAYEDGKQENGSLQDANVDHGGGQGFHGEARHNNETRHKASEWRVGPRRRSRRQKINLESVILDDVCMNF